MRGFILYPTYKVHDDKPYVYLFGKLLNGESFLLKKRYRPYFYVRESDLEKVLKRKRVEYEKTNFKNFSGERVSKIFTKIPREVGELRRILEGNGIPCFEADIRFAYRFMFDLDIKGYVEIHGDYEKGERVSRIYEDPLIEASEEVEIPLKVLSLDIEVNENTGKVISVALLHEISEVLLLEGKVKGALSFSSEKQLLKTLRKRILEIDPDVIVGWNVIDFDLKYLEERFRKYNLNLDIGRSEERVKFRSESSFIRASRAKIEGRIILDAMHLMRDFFIRVSDYKLNTAAEAILQEKKLLIDRDLEKVWKEDPQRLVEYNRRDAELVLKIIEKKKLIELSRKMSGITGMQLDRVKASIASLDSLYLRRARRKGLVCPSVSREERIRVVGGLVQEPKFGIYDYVLVFDFKSLYPSVIATFNIDPLTFTEEKTRIRAPNGAYFTDRKAILPEIILELLEKRDNATSFEESYAIKIIMNSFFGVLGNPNCRFYNSKIANAITAFGRHFLEMTTSKIEELSFKTIYGDTDSVFVLSKAKTLGEAEKIGRRIEREINSFYDEFVKRKYKRPNYLKLEFEKLYEKFYLPKQRHIEAGAKKRYAGLMDGKLDIVGLEYVRRDWTELAKKFQYNLLFKVFHKEDYKTYIKEFIDDLKRGELDELLVYKKGVRKELKRYTKTTPPHVKAARKLENFKDRMISYVMTKNGPEPLERITSKIDYSHYIEKQLKPIADSILTFYGESFEDILAGSKQMKLSDFL